VWSNQCNTNIFNYSNIQILGGEYFVFEYEYLFSSVQIYLIFIFGQIDLTKIYSVHIQYVFAGYSAYLRYIFEYQAPNINYSNKNILFHWKEYIRYSYSVKIKVINIFLFGSEFDIRVTLDITVLYETSFMWSNNPVYKSCFVCGAPTALYLTSFVCVLWTLCI
jgi:hypothetical protein